MHQYREPNANYGAPYTMFNIEEFGNNKSSGVSKRIDEIRSLILIIGSDFRTMYKDQFMKPTKHYTTVPIPQ